MNEVALQQEVEAEEVQEEEGDDLDTRATVLLGVQQISSSFSYRAAEFAFPLFFIVLYTNTLLPASVRLTASEQIPCTS
jgi:hypothetical protein